MDMGLITDDKKVPKGMTKILDLLIYVTRDTQPVYGWETEVAELIVQFAQRNNLSTEV